MQQNLSGCLDKASRGMDFMKLTENICK